MLLAASTQRSIGLIIFAVIVIGFALYLFFNSRAARPEVGSELELAPNRKPYLDDSELEGSKLDKTLLTGLAMLMVISVGLPLYWLGEPGRHDGLIELTDEIFTRRGTALYEEGADCQACHGAQGSGGSTTYTLTDNEGNFIATVAWTAPSLNTVLSRYSEDEITHILNYGRNNVMPAWGAPGGGPLTEQQLEYLIYYLRSIQIPEADIRSTVDQGIRDGIAQHLNVANNDPSVDEWLASVEETVEEARSMALAADSSLAGDEDAIRSAGLELLSAGKTPGSELYLTYGRIIFNNKAASGTYSCARCHTYGWSFDATTDGDDNIDGHPGPILEAYKDGGGFFGPNLTGGSTLDQFETAAEHADFISQGQDIGQTYGRGGAGGNGQMPGFGPRRDDNLEVAYPETLTPDQIDAVTAFERNL
ncbi:MAG: cytochrome c [Acidimicrobiaceae bacterium]|nr:cytochrome c [Acidimicrobiaceae bacterium]